MILGIGIDIIGVSRFDQGETNQAFLNKVFTPKEIEECLAQRRPAEGFAEKFVLKEAFMKAIGAGIRQKVWFTNIEVLNGENGKPKIIPEKMAKHYFDALNAKEIQLSSSSSGGVVVGVVVLTA